MEEKLYTAIIQDYKNRENDLKKDYENMKALAKSEEAKHNESLNRVKSLEIEIATLKEQLKNLDNQKPIVKETVTVYKNTNSNTNYNIDYKKLYSLCSSIKNYTNHNSIAYEYLNKLEEKIYDIEHITNSKFPCSINKEYETEYLNLDSVKQELRKELEKEYKKEIDDLKLELKKYKLEKESDLLQKDEKYISQINELKNEALENKRLYDEEIRELKLSIQSAEDTISNLKNRNPEKYVSKVIYESLLFKYEELNNEIYELEDRLWDYRRSVDIRDKRIKELKSKKRVNIFNFFKKDKEAA